MDNLIPVPDGISASDFYTSIFAIGILEEACKLGYVESTKYKASPKGIGLFDQLLASEYLPNALDLMGFYCYISADADFAADMMPITELVLREIKVKEVEDEV